MANKRMRSGSFSAVGVPTSEELEAFAEELARFDFPEDEEDSGREGRRRERKKKRRSRAGGRGHERGDPRFGDEGDAWR